MLIFIDESGDSGFKLTRGSTSHFVVAMVIFKNKNDAEHTSEVIKNIQKQLKINPEFKFAKSRDYVKDEFFNRIYDCRFKIRALVVDKNKIYSQNLRENKENFYNFFVKNLVNYHEIKINDVSIKIDGSGTREFRQELQRYLKSQINSKSKLKVKLVDSKKDSLIQLADMVAGAIARSYSNEHREGKSKWLDTLNGGDKIEDIWNFR